MNIGSSKSRFQSTSHHHHQPPGNPSEPERIGVLQTQRTEFDGAIAEVVDTRDAAKAATRHKQRIRSEYAKNLRTAARMIQANDKVSDAACEAAGVHVRKTTHTPVSVPKTFPVGYVMSSDRLQHTLSYNDSSTPSRRARPVGASGCEIYLYTGDEVTQQPSRFRFLMLSTRSPQTIDFAEQDASRTANYLLRWVNTKGEHDPWSQIISATIPAV